MLYRNFSPLVALVGAYLASDAQRYGRLPKTRRNGLFLRFERHYQTTVTVGGDWGVSEGGTSAVGHIVGAVTPFEVLKNIVHFVLIAVIHLWQSVRIRYERLRDQSVNIAGFPLAVR